VARCSSCTSSGRKYDDADRGSFFYTRESRSDELASRERAVAGLQTNKRHRFISKGAEHEFSRPAEMASTHSGVPRNASVLADTEAAVAATFGRDLERAVAQLASNASALLDSALGRLPDVAAQVRAACRCRRSFYDDPSFFIYCVLPPACSRACRGKEGSSCV
jgi:hypothetical protein